MNRCPKCITGILYASRTDKGDKDCAWCGYVEYKHVRDPLLGPPRREPRMTTTIRG